MVARMIRLFLVEDEALIRAALSELLAMAPGIEVIGAAGSGEQALAALATLDVDIVLMDVRLPGISGPETLRLMRERGLNPKVLFITTFDDDQAMMEALRLGANGFLRKDVSLEQLREAIEDVMAGKTVLRRALSTHGLDRLKSLRPRFESSDLPEPLTPRETEVLRCMACGMSNREIGAVFGMTEGTVKTHASTIFGKLGVRDRTRAVLRALDLGIL